MLLLLTLPDYDHDEVWAEVYKKEIRLKRSSAKMAVIVFVLGICVILMGWSGAAPNDRELFVKFIYEYTYEPKHYISV